MPKVSVIICVYNQPLVREAVESALRQKFADFEIIIVDDGSTDETARIVAHYSGSAQILRQENKGVAAARNRGLSAASGQYIAFLDADDLWTPGYLSEQVAFLESNPGCQLAFTDGWAVAGKDVPQELQSKSSYYSSKPLPAGKDSAQNFFISGVVTSFTVIRRALFEKTGWFDEHFRIHEDADLLLRALEQGIEFCFIPRPLAIKRNLQTRLTQEKQALQLSRIIQINSWRRSPKLRPILRKSIPITNRLIASQLLEKGEKAQARKFLLEALRYRPWALRTLLLAIGVRP